MFQPVNPRQSFPELEHEMLDFWQQNHIFERSVEQRKGHKKYVFFDGPPFANGLPHYGHILAGSLKDAVTRYWTMRGYYVPRENGWDCHGLPVEYEIEKELKLTGRKQIVDMGVEKFNNACRESVFRYTHEWEKLIKRLGRWVDFDNSYATLDNSYMESIWWVFKQIWDKKKVYEGYKSMHICPRCETTLSNFEVSQGYKDITDFSVVAKFKLVDVENTYILGWTTTPWTLPANVALCFNPDLEYVKVSSVNEHGKEEFYILAKDRVAAVFKEKPYTIIEDVDQDELEGKSYEPLFDFYKDVVAASSSEKKPYVIVLDPYVTTEDGTGVVHQAPMFGEDDHRVCAKYGLTEFFFQHVKLDGSFVDRVIPWAGKFVKSQDQNIVTYMKEHGLVFDAFNIRHSYPHCWRCDTPLLNYFTTSWFIRVTDVKDDLILNNKKITWQPPHIQEGRFGKWLEGARDWAISRNRFWGCPIPIWKCTSDACKNVVCVSSQDDLSKRSGGNLPMRDGKIDLHKPYIDDITFACEKCGSEMRRISDVFDCWFESGAMPYAQLHYPFENKKEFEDNFPADFIAEGLDQTRGWFYTLHVISTILFNKPAFKNVIVNGILLAADGEKLSKRKKNYPDPNQLFDSRGVDSVRLFLYTSPATLADDVRFSEKHVDEMVKQFTLTVWNVYSFFMTYASLDKWTPMKDTSKFKPTHTLDQWMLSELNALVQTVTDSMDSYNLMAATRPLIAFADDLSNWYVRRSRRRFWKSESDEDKQSAYQTLHTVLLTLSHLIAPFMPFMADGMYQGLVKGQPDAPDSVHLADWPTITKNLLKPLLNEEMHIVRQIVNLGHSARAAASMKVRQPLSSVQIACPDVVSEDVIEKYRDVILEELNVKSVDFVKDIGESVTVIYTPKSRVLGPKYGGDVQNIIKMVKSGQIEPLKDGTYKVGEFTLTGEELEVGYKGKDGTGVASENGYTVILDTVLTSELIEEGIARDVIRLVQDMRKEAKYDVSDRIVVLITSEDVMFNTAVEKMANVIRKETLAEELRQSGDLEDSDLAMDQTIEDMKFKVSLRKVTR